MILIRRIRQNPSRLQGEKSSALDLARGRMVMMGGFFVLAYCALALRAVDLSVLQSQSYDPEVAPKQTASAPTLRADIIDRNGVMLATTLKTPSLFADTKQISDPQKTAKALHAIFPDVPYGQLLQKLQSGRSFVWLKRNITPQEKARVLEIGEPGLNFETAQKRFYPQENLTAHILGYTDIDMHGIAGIERGFDNILNESKPLQLTIDTRIQHALKREIAAAMDEFRAIGGAGVVMDVQTGEILAGVSLPDFNPHAMSAAKDDATFNRLTLGAYELGSVFKIFSTAYFFETRDMPMSTTFDATEPLKKGRHTIRDFHAQKRPLTVPEVFMHSSNIGTAMMAEAAGFEGMKDFYTDLGLLTPLDFEIRETARPQVQPWTEITALTASYGHGIATTPLQVATAVASIVNGGYRVKPTLIKNDTPQTQTEDIRIVSEKTAHRLRQLLRIVVSEGTGSKAAVAGYKVGGKTGTAEKITNGRYDRKKKISSFVGVFPMNAPKYAVYIMVDEPKGHKGTWGYATGGWVAAPAVSRVIASMANILGIPPETEIAGQEFGSGLKQYISHKEGAR
ncbi:MAG: peptidoglycan D,D-transpeptidase FtsI family protein [Alphaproteobacteria bacterium]